MDGSHAVVVDANQRDRSWWEFAGGNNVVATDFDITVPRRTQLDLRVSKSFTLSGSSKLQVMADLFNALNSNAAAHRRGVDSKLLVA